MIAAREALPQLAGPTWVMARRQSAGRGRRARAWIMPVGNLAATLIFKPDATPADAAKRSFMAANALYQALRIVAPAADLALKWPNDVLLNGGKVAGILLEAASLGPRVDWLAIGIGVNLVGHPAVVQDSGSGHPVNLQAETGLTIAAEDFLTLLAQAYAEQERLLASEGFTRIRQDWLAHAARLGETIIARTQTAEYVGIFETVDEDGNLCLRNAEGVISIPAADIYF